LKADWYRSSAKMIDTIVIGAGPAGVLAALRAAELGARTMLVTRAEFGGMAANDGPVPVRTLAHAARLIREARQLGQYGIGVSEPVLNYPRLLERVREWSMRQEQTLNPPPEPHIWPRTAGSLGAPA
jgi:pyruvate/2-oxoglutarate dehydrogenase complex dihydrolipoamide dehydrogenase (E3) component